VYNTWDKRDQRYYRSDQAGRQHTYPTIVGFLVVAALPEHIFSCGRTSVEIVTSYVSRIALLLVDFDST
jgi:hypothetical protein